ncbi:serine/threonine-protein phosphatase 6 regulatory ankyrin repeat subunit B-like [Nasonia vitripennis]|uniref:Uncharacterized protein n=1 Tax=Nasonia vitripennis TaxID=7425 RepID=A0A7M7M2E9_NASVI|nr:serine/threonine-protein phosphatase 6 regulatory ankyrin repeat subunit B-like [Nasonia vitripennis]
MASTSSYRKSVMCRVPYRPVKFGIMNQQKEFDLQLSQKLREIFKKRSFTDADVNEFLRISTVDSDYDSAIELILEQQHFPFNKIPKDILAQHSILWIAVFGACFSTLELLVCFGADLIEPLGKHAALMRVITNMSSLTEKSTVLHALIDYYDGSENKQQLIRSMIEREPKLLLTRDSMGLTALICAVKQEYIELVEMFLEKAAAVNAPAKEGITPLLFAAGTMERCSEIIPLLLRHGADINCKDYSEENILHYLSFAPGKNNAVVDMARGFIQRGIPVDKKSLLCEHQPIHYAARMGRLELMLLYLDHGADVNALTADGSSPLHYAATSPGNSRLLRTLLERGANVQQRIYDNRGYSSGRTALHDACDEFQDENIRVLLSAGADLTSEDGEGNTPLSLIPKFFFYNLKNTSVVFMMLKMLAMKKVRQPEIVLKDETLIRSNRKLSKFFQDLVEQLERTKTTSIIQNFTFYQLLTICHCQTARFMRNPDLQINFERHNMTEFSTWAEDLTKAFKRARSHYCAVLEQEETIDEAFYCILPYLITRMMVHYIYNCCANVK